MKETAIRLDQSNSALAEWSARAHREQTTFVFLDAAGPVARLVPTTAKICTGADLRRQLASATLSPEEAQAWAEDLRKARASLSAPEDKWG